MKKHYKRLWTLVKNHQDNPKVDGINYTFTYIKDKVFDSRYITSDMSFNSPIIYQKGLSSFINTLEKSLEKTNPYFKKGKIITSLKNLIHKPYNSLNQTVDFKTHYLLVGYHSGYHQLIYSHKDKLSKYLKVLPKNELILKAIPKEKPYHLHFMEDMGIFGYYTEEAYKKYISSMFSTYYS